MQNPSPESAGPPFRDAAAIPEAQRYQLQIDAIGSPRISRSFEQLKQKQSHEMETHRARLEDARETTVQALVRDAMDARMKRIWPELKPKFLRTDDRATQERFARKDAEIKYRQAADAHLQKKEMEHLGQQRVYVARAMRVQQAKDTFNQRAKEGRER